MNRARTKRLAGVVCLALSEVVATASMVTANTFNGRAYAAYLRAPILGVGPLYVADTGETPPSGGFAGAGELGVTVPLVLSTGVLHAATSAANADGIGGRTVSESSLSAIRVLPGNVAELSAAFVRAGAEALESGVSGSVDIEALTFGGKSIQVTGLPNQKVVIPGFLGVPLATLVINEQMVSESGSVKQIVVNALHLTLATGDEFVLASARSMVDSAGEVLLARSPGGAGTPSWAAGCGGPAAIAPAALTLTPAATTHSQPGPCFDFVMGSGWFAPTPDGSDRGAFAFFAGRIEGGGPAGGLWYKDHNTGMKVKSTRVTDYRTSGASSRIFEGTAEVNGQRGFTFQAEVADDGFDGADRFRIALSNGYVADSGGAGHPTDPSGIDRGEIILVAPCPSDETPPAVSITSPASGATVSGTVTVTAAASDDVGVAGVQFRLDGAPLGAEDATAPYSAAWDTTAVADGAHTLTAMARDEAGNTTTSSPVTVTVANGPPPDTTPPSVSVTSPASGAMVSGTVTVTVANGTPPGARIEETDPAVGYTGTWIQGDMSRAWSGGTAAFSTEAGARATLSFNGTSVSWVGFRGPQTGIARVFLDGALAAEVDTYAATEQTQVSLFSTSALSAGAHTLAVESTGTKNTASSNTVVVVDAFDVGGGAGGPGDTTPPAVSITSPASGATVSGTVTVTADASDNAGVAGVQFRLDGAPLGAEDAAAPYAVTWDTTAVADGSHTLTAVARDGAGNTATSSPVTVTVANGGGGTATRIEQSDPSITYTESVSPWFLDDPEKPGWSGGTASWARGPGNRATFTFSGARVTFISWRSSQGGIARLFLDGAEVAEVDLYSTTEELQAPVFTSGVLASGTHTLVVEVTGVANPSSTTGDTVVVVDAFDVTP